jgi:hypothetical protein
MHYLKKYLLSFFLFSTLCIQAQDGTRTAKTKEISGRIMLIPFEPKLYMSEIDIKINEKTKWKFETIRENFRHQLDTQLKLKLKNIGSVVSFYSDSIQTCKDLEYIYKSTNIYYDLVAKPSSAIAIPVNQSGIKNGQVAVEISEEKKFMNTKINDKELLGYLNKKYKSEYFVFINELDIKNDPNSYDAATDTYQREIVVHYTILDKLGKTVSAGISASRFSSKINEPKKIVANYFSITAGSISEKLSAYLNPKTPDTIKK